MSRLTLIVCAVITSISFSSEPEVTVLDNGLTVITQELHYAPVIASVITYGAGSRNESGANMGISHFCEHMMFKGTPDLPYGRFWQIVQRDGGFSNAMEGKDVTYYYLMLPSSRVEDALMIESDRMINCLMDSAEVVSEINVVHEERRMNSIDSADGALLEALYGMAFTEHPYGKPVLGYDENILGFDHNMVRDFYETYYCPSNAVLTIVGDFNTSELLAQVEEYFGNIPGGNVPDEFVSAEPMQTEPGYVEIEHSSNLPRFSMSFHSPSGTDPLNPAMTMIATYLSSGRSSRLIQLLVDTELVYRVWLMKDNDLDPGLFTIHVTMNPPEEGGATMDEISSVIWNELHSLAENGIPQDVLDDLRNKYQAREILNSSFPLTLAYNYCLSFSKFNNPLYNEEQREQIELLTPEDISEAASTYFVENLVNIAVLVPSEDGGAGGIGGNELPTGVAEPSSINYEGLEIPDEFLSPPSGSIADGVVEYQLDNVLSGVHQARNLAGVVAGLSLLLPVNSYSSEQLRSRFHGTRIAGRLQLLQSPLNARLFADVGHNQDAARMLADNLQRLKLSEGRVVVLLGMLQDKQPDLFVEALKSVVDAWWLMTLDTDRGLDAAGLASRVDSLVDVDQHFETVHQALDHALSSLGNQDIMLVTGSFVTVELLLRALSDSGELN